jgi:hypothetical protein
MYELDEISSKSKTVEPEYYQTPNGALAPMMQEPE